MEVKGALRYVRRRGSHIVYTIGEQMAVRLTALKLEYLDVTVFGRGVGEVRVVVGRAPTC
jgi:hypothetical protein